MPINKLVNKKEVRSAEHLSLVEVFLPMNRLEIDGKEPLIAEHEGEAIAELAFRMGSDKTVYPAR